MDNKDLENNSGHSKPGHIHLSFGGWNFILIIVFLIVFFPSRNIQKDCFPAFRVVIDPGHGGVGYSNKKKHGDKYDMISGKYLSYFAEGAAYRRIYERDVVYSVAQKAVKLLSYCSRDGDFKKFSRILKKYTKKKPKRIFIETIISRGKSVPRGKAKKMADPNGPYRLYDYPDDKGVMKDGRISMINKYKPHLVVSIHLAKSAPHAYKGMNAIIVPPYNVLKQGLIKLRKGKSRKIRDRGILDSWFRAGHWISPLNAYYKDVSYYFTGFDINKKYRPDHKDFRGYRYNMINWNYRDAPGWNKSAAKHKKNTRYADYYSFREKGKFWEREKSIFERYRRGDSFKNFGGDNYFASNEIIKYIYLSLQKKGIQRKDKFPGKPFISVWSVPLLVNAISAYVEIGYLDRKWDRKVLIKKHNEIAEGVAVGVYSLLAGIDKIKGNSRRRPSGKKIDLDKYNITNDKSYFDIVTE